MAFPRGVSITELNESITIGIDLLMRVKKSVEIFISAKVFDV